MAKFADIKTWLLSFWLIASGSAWAGSMDEAQLQDIVSAAQKEQGLVGLGSVVLFGDGTQIGPVVAGSRKKNGDPLEPDDAFHIGSNTKMLTAMICAQRVAEGRMRWEMTLPEMFPEHASEMHEDWSDVTLKDLLAHRSGLAANPSKIWFVGRLFDERPLTEQRVETMISALRQPAPNPKGEFLYSNLGFIIAGTALEAEDERYSGESRRPYEEIFTSVLLANEAETSWGFGPPQAGALGHSPGLFSGISATSRGPGGDNPAALGPAGTAHVNLSDHAHMLLPLLKATRVEGVYSELLVAYPDDTADYGLGIGIAEDKIIGRFYAHSGSNTFWLSKVILVPELDLIVVTDSNQWTRTTQNALNEVERKIIYQIASD